MRRFVSILSLLAAFGSAPASAQNTDVVVGVPIENGQAGKPQPGVIVDIEGQRNRARNATPTPVIVQDGAQGGTTTVTPNFGGGYTVQNENQGATTVRPKFGGGYTVEQNGRTTQEVTPNFGGGYKVKSAPGAPTTVVVPPVDR
jgi:hypothetical protein